MLAPTYFGSPGPTSGSLHWALLKLQSFCGWSVKIHHYMIVVLW